MVEICELRVTSYVCVSCQLIEVSRLEYETMRRHQICTYTVCGVVYTVHVLYSTVPVRCGAARRGAVYYIRLRTGPSRTLSYFYPLVVSFETFFASEKHSFGLARVRRTHTH